MKPHLEVLNSLVVLLSTCYFDSSPSSLQGLHCRSLSLCTSVFSLDPSLSSKTSPKLFILFAQRTCFTKIIFFRFYFSSRPFRGLPLMAAPLLFLNYSFPFIDMLSSLPFFSIIYVLLRYLAAESSLSNPFSEWVRILISQSSLSFMSTFPIPSSALS